MNGDDGITFRYVGFTKIESLPSGGNEAIRALSLSEAEDEAYMNLQLAPFEGSPQAPDRRVSDAISGRHHGGRVPACVARDE